VSYNLKPAVNAVNGGLRTCEFAGISSHFCLFRGSVRSVGACNVHRLSTSVGVKARYLSESSGPNALGPHRVRICPELAEHVNCCELKLIRFWPRKNSRSGEYGTIFTKKGDII